jgi:Zn-finger nucleic acid-binding protein
MERGRFAAASSVVIDVCDEHGVWLDAGELGQVVHQASQRMIAEREAAERDPRARLVAALPMQPAAAQRTSVSTHVKRVVALGAILYLLFRAVVMFGPGRSSAMKNHGQDSARAAEGANTALGH